MYARGTMLSSQGWSANWARAPKPGQQKDSHAQTVLEAMIQFRPPPTSVRESSTGPSLFLRFSGKEQELKR